MLALKTRLVVTSGRTATVELPLDVPPGEHTAILVFDEPAAGAAARPRPGEQMRDFPVHDVGPWPEGLSLRREDMYGDDGR